MEYPDQLRVVRTRWTERELEALGERIMEDASAGDGFIDGYGDAGFLVWGTFTDEAQLVVQVVTPRRDAARALRERYGPAVKVVVKGRRFECSASF